MWAIIHPSGKLTQTQMCEPKWTSDWNGWETGCIVWFAWVTSLLISLLPFVLMIIAKKVSFMKTTYFFYKDCTPWFKPSLCSFSSQLPKGRLLSLQLLWFSVKHKLCPGLRRGLDLGPTAFAFESPHGSPAMHPSLSRVSACTKRQWGNSSMEKWEVKTQSLFE